MLAKHNLSPCKFKDSILSTQIANAMTLRASMTAWVDAFRGPGVLCLEQETCPDMQLALLPFGRL